jgi:hypothetical protein
MIDWDLRKFRILRELQRQGTVSAAARALSLTPSAVSQSMYRKFKRYFANDHCCWRTSFPPR